MVDRRWYTYTIAPHQVLVDAVVLRAHAVCQWLDSEAFLEQQKTYGFHHGDGVYLIAKQGLLAPHASDEELLLLKEKREDSVQNMNGTFNFGKLVFVLQDSMLRGCLVHDFDGVRDQMDNIVGFGILNRSQIVQAYRSEDIDEIIRGLEKLIEII